MPKITVVIESGRVTTVDDIPTDTVVEVRNYDVSRVPAKLLSRDGDGRACEVREWRAPE